MGLICNVVLLSKLFSLYFFLNSLFESFAKYFQVAVLIYWSFPFLTCTRTVLEPLPLGFSPATDIDCLSGLVPFSLHRLRRFFVDVSSIFSFKRTNMFFGDKYDRYKNAIQIFVLIYAS